MQGRSESHLRDNEGSVGSWEVVWTCSDLRRRCKTYMLGRPLLYIGKEGQVSLVQ